MPFVGLTSTHGNHWSVGLASTWVGPVQLVPPFVDVIRNTSVLVMGLSLSCVPLRLSEKARYSVPFSEARGLATMFPAELVRSW